MTDRELLTDIHTRCKDAGKGIETKDELSIDTVLVMADVLNRIENDIETQLNQEN